MAGKRSILHFVTPLGNVSPFDVNMAVDAGFDVVVPYSRVEAGEVTALVQDAMFSRAPEDGRHTAILIGGRDPVLALDMLEAARAAMLPPHFEISLMADPSGAFTTAAGMIAVTEKHLRAMGRELAGTEIAIFGATGPVGGAAAIIAARAGAEVVLVGHDGLERVAARSTSFKERFGVSLRAADGRDDPGKARVLQTAEVALAAGKAGVQVLSKDQLAAAPGLLVALDVNAVPPAGLEGVDPFDDGKPLRDGKALGVGALAVGNVKFRTEHELLAAMTDAKPRRHQGLEEAFESARRHAAG